MTNLPVPIDTEEAIALVTQWAEKAEERMTAQASRQWLEVTLREYLLHDLIDRMQVIAEADAGDEIADAALAYVFHSMMDRGETPPASLVAYEARARLRGPVKRSAGRNKYDNWKRDIGIAVLVYRTILGLAPTRNREQRRRQQPSACSFVTEALGRRSQINAAAGHPERQINVSEKRVESIWGGLLGQMNPLGRQK